MATAATLPIPAIAVDAEVYGSPREAAAYLSDDTLSWDDTVYFASRASRVTAISGSSTQTQFVSGLDARGVAVNGLARRVYVTSQSQDTILNYNLGLGDPRPTTLATGSNPYSVAVDPNDDTVYVTAWGSSATSSDDSLFVFAGPDVAIATPAVLPLAGKPWDIAVDVDDDTIYVALGTGGLQVISGSLDDSFIVPISILVGTQDVAVAVHPTDDTVYVYGKGGAAAVTNYVLASAPTFGDDSALYATGFVDPEGGGGMAVSLSGNELAVTSYHDVELAIFDTSDMAAGPVRIPAYQGGLTCTKTPNYADPVVGVRDGWVVGAGNGLQGSDDGCASTITATPDPTGITPALGSPAGGTAVTISGTGFTQGLTTVTFDDTPAASVVVVDDATISAVTPAGALGAVDVKVKTGVLDDSIVGGFTYSSATVPSAPQSPAAAGGDATATVTWSAPASDGGSGLTGYTVTSNPGAFRCSTTATPPTTPATTCTITGLTNGTSYVFDVTATNAVGGSPAATSNAVVPSDPTPPTPPVTYPPSDPLNVTGLAGDASAVVSWSTPASAGTFAITDYQVVVSPGGQSCTVAAPALSCMITGLTNGTAYTATVRALNGAGWGPFSQPSNTFTPIDPTPPVEKSIVITGSRTEIDGRSGVRALGETTGLAGQVVQARVHLSGEVDYYDGSRRTIGTDGSFTWQRKTNKKVYLYFRVVDDGTRSNRIVINIR